MKKNFLNIVPQEVTDGGERTIRYKGNDGKYHSIASGDAGDAPTLSVEQVTRTVQISLTNPSASPSIADFMLKYGSMKLTNFKILSMRYNSTSMTKLYFENGVQGPTPYRYNLTSAKVTFEINASVMDEISRETFNTGSAEVIDFFERTVMSIIDDVTPYMIYYFMLKANFIIQWSEFTGTELHLFSTAKDGTKTDLGVLNQNYQ